MGQDGGLHGLLKFAGRLGKARDSYKQLPGSDSDAGTLAARDQLIHEELTDGLAKMSHDDPKVQSPAKTQAPAPDMQTRNFAEGPKQGQAAEIAAYNKRMLSSRNKGIMQGGMGVGAMIGGAFGSILGPGGMLLGAALGAGLGAAAGWALGKATPMKSLVAQKPEHVTPYTDDVNANMEIGLNSGMIMDGINPVDVAEKVDKNIYAYDEPKPLELVDGVVESGTAGGTTTGGMTTAGITTAGITTGGTTATTMGEGGETNSVTVSTLDPDLIAGARTTTIEGDRTTQGGGPTRIQSAPIAMGKTLAARQIVPDSKAPKAFDPDFSAGTSSFKSGKSQSTKGSSAPVAGGRSVVARLKDPMTGQVMSDPVKTSKGTMDRSTAMEILAGKRKMRGGGGSDLKIHGSDSTVRNELKAKGYKVTGKR